MAVAYKAQGTIVVGTTTTLAVPMPALAVDDYATVVIIAFAAGTITPPSGWAEAGTAWQEATLYYHVFWKKATATAVAGNVNFTVPTGGGIGKSSTVTGAANTAPTWTHVNNTSAAYIQSPPITVAGFYIQHGLAFAARPATGAFTTTGTISSTNSLKTPVETPSGTSYRYALASFIVASVTSGAMIRETVSGGSATSDAILILIPPDTGDSTPPSATITVPAAAATVAGSMTLTATLTDNVAVASASAKMDGTTNLGALTHGAGSTWTLVVDTTVIPNGSHSIVVTALDSSGNSATASVTFTIDNEFSTISLYDGSTETPLDAQTATYWDGTNEFGFWYPVDAPANTLLYWDGTTETALRLHDAPTTSALDGLVYLAVGDSYGVVQTAGGVDYTSSDLFPQQLAAALGATLTNGHVNSYMAMDVAYLLNNVSNGSGGWTIGYFGMMTVHVGGNDLKLVGTDAGMREYINGIEAIIGLARMATRVLAEDSTSSSGSWSSAANAGTSGGALYSNAPGASLTFTKTGTGFTLFLLTTRDGLGCPYTVTVDGTVVTTGTTVGQAATNPVVSGSYGLVPVHLAGLSSGSHTIVVTHAGTGSQYLSVDSLGIWQTNNDNVPYILFSASPNPPEDFEVSAGVSVTDAQIQEYRDALRAILVEHADVGKFGQLLPDSYDKIFWDAVAAPGSNLLISDGMHPNKAGMALLAEIWIGNARRVFPA